jgi:hypothetical protein
MLSIVAGLAAHGTIDLKSLGSIAAAVVGPWAAFAGQTRTYTWSFSVGD